MMNRRGSALSAAAAGLLAAVLAGCGAAPTTAADLSGQATGSPVTIGISEPLTGSFQADGIACKQGYELWASDVNSHGGLLGHKVVLTILNDNSDPKKVVADYRTLIQTDHVNFVLGPFSTLLTAAAGPIVAKSGYSFVEASGGGGLVFSLKQHNIFAVSPAVADYMAPFAKWIASLPPSQRPKTAAYPMVNDPFAFPPVQTAQQILTAAGVTNVYSKIFPEDANSSAASEAKFYRSYAEQVAALAPQMVLLGSTDVGTVEEFVKVFQEQHYNPQMFIAAAGPDQGQAFINAVGVSNATGIMVPNGWYGGMPNALSRVMVQDYIATYGGTASDVNADVAESYSAGEVLTDAVNATHSLSNAAVIKYLHSGVTLQTVQGPARFPSNLYGVNSLGATFIFQWKAGAHFVQVLPTNALGSVSVLSPKPNWAG